jgi:hypothetical protein
MTDIEKAIRTEICKALENLGGPSKLLASIRDAPKEAMYEAAERLGGDRQLLYTIGSWGDKLTDEQVLFDLREWNTEPALGNR